MNRPSNQLDFFSEHAEQETVSIEKTNELSLDRWDESSLRSLLQQWLLPLGLEDLSSRVTVKWNSRLRTTAGRAHYLQGRIELNPRLIEVSDADEIERTMKHELAHLVAFERCRKSRRRRLQAHGAEWREACADLDIAGESRCHDLALPSRKMRRKYAYVCPSCSAVIERVRRFKGYVSCYPCCKKYSGGRYDKCFQLVEGLL